MKTLLNTFKNGSTFLLEVPVPRLVPGHVLIQSHMSLLSSGTEKMLIEFGKANYFEKALKHPEKVKEVIQKASTDGLVSTFNSVKNKLDEAIPLGYSNVGTIVGLGKGVKNFNIGDRVVSNGCHAEFVSVPQNLCAKIPNEVDDELAVFTVLGSIGLNGIRLANPLFGETFLVSGLGIIGLLTAQLLKANGCRVIGIDPDNSKCLIASRLGIETFKLDQKTNPLDWLLAKTGNIGLDGVLITATTNSNEPVELAAKSLRKRGRIIMIGQTGLNLDRNLFYKKEISFQVSCSYGPGRYDKQYEEFGNDYPIGYVRWTEQRNFEAVLNAMANKKVKKDELITKIFDFKEAVNAYKYLLDNSSSLGLILKYSKNHSIKNNNIIALKESKNLKSFSSNKKINSKINISFIGAGNYAKTILIPAFIKTQANLKTIASNNGVNPTILGKKFKFEYATTEVDKTISSNESNTIVITTRHNSHAELILKSLKAGKNIFVEKPLCLNQKDLEKIEKSCLEENVLMVGFNRRFSPYIKDLKNILDKINKPKAFIYTCNAGEIDNEHWSQDRNIGGGRLIGEACHFVDLLRFLSGVKIVDLNLNTTKEAQNSFDTFSLSINFEDGSIGTIHYFSNGSKYFPKERLEVFTANTIFRIDNYMRLESWGSNSIKDRRSLFQNKGQTECVDAFVNAIKNKTKSPTPLDEILEVHKWLFNLSK